MNHPSAGARPSAAGPGGGRPALGSPIITSLYVPGDRPERFDKAVATGAQLVILDLEDAVAPERKAAARAHVVDWLRLRPDESPLLEVRINPGSTPADQRDDLAVLSRVSGRFGIRVPKAETVDDIDRVVAAMGRDVAIAALIESAAGVEAAPAIAGHRMVTSVAVGEADLASDLGTAERGVLDWAQFRVLYAARAAGKMPPAAPVYPDIGDLDGLKADTAGWRAKGFLGRTAIHPSQVPVIADAFRPADDEIAWAREVLAVVGAGGVGTLASGEMVDAAMVGRAGSIIALADIRSGHATVQGPVVSGDQSAGGRSASR